MELILEKDKVCKGSIRYSEKTTDSNPRNIYLPNADVAALGNPQTIKVTIEAI